MEETEQIVRESWITCNWGSFKITRNFFAWPIYQDCDTRERTKIFSIEYPCTSRRVSIDTCMKELNRVNLENERVATSRDFKKIGAFWRFLIARIPKWYIPADLLSQKNVFLWSLRYWKKLIQRIWKKFKYFCLCSAILLMIYFLAFWENQNFCPNFLKKIRRETVYFSYVWIIVGKKSQLLKSPKFCRKNPVFAIKK